MIIHVIEEKMKITFIAFRFFSKIDVRHGKILFSDAVIRVWHG